LSSSITSTTKQITKYPNTQIPKYPNTTNKQANKQTGQWLGLLLMLVLVSGVVMVQFHNSIVDSLEDRGDKTTSRQDNKAMTETHAWQAW
jgi:hypothetical protein